MKYRSMIALLLAVLMLCSMAACSSEDEPKKNATTQGTEAEGATDGATKETNTTVGSAMSTTDSNTAIMGSTIVLEVVTTKATTTMKKPTTTKKPTATKTEATTTVAGSTTTKQPAGTGVTATTKKSTSAIKTTATSGKATTTVKNTTTQTSAATGVQVGPLVLTIEDYHGNGYMYRDVSVENPNYMLKLTAAEDLVSVRLMSFNADTTKPESVLRTLRALRKGDTQYIYTYVSEAAPVRGIACTDTTGKNRYFVFCYSGRGDGAPVYLEEIRVGH